MKMKTLIKTSMLLVVVGLLAACASEDTQQKEETKQPETKFVATFTGYQPNVNEKAKTRTTATYTKGNPAQVFWEATDMIWVKSDDGYFYRSEAANFAASSTPADHSRANFYLSAGSYMKFNPMVRYTGLNGTSNQVTISSAQTQSAPNDFSHLGAAGDCGTAIARGGGNDHEFTLEHKASYLCFMPRCMDTQLGPNIKLTKIVVTANKDIAGTYDFSNGSLKGKTPTGGSKTITLNLGGAGDFSLNTTTENISKNGAYMVIAPGTYDLTIAYTLADVNGQSGDIVKTLKNFDCPEGLIKDVKANLTPLEIGKFYTWDAQQHYWLGYENEQPFISSPNPGATQGQHYPTSGPRYASSVYPGPHVQNDAQTAHFKSLPNVNEMMWYVYKGQPLGEAPKPRLFAHNGHLRVLNVGGVWLKKKAKIMEENHVTADLMKNYFPGRVTASSPITNIDWRKYPSGVWPAAWLLFSAGPHDDLSNYFFLPALGRYQYGWWINQTGKFGYYFSSSGFPQTSGYGFGLAFDGQYITVEHLYRFYGTPIGTFE